MLSYLRVLAARLRGFVSSRDLDQEFEEELEAHLAMAEEEMIRRGMTPKEARRRARVELGGVTQLREAGREARGLPWLDSFWLDIKLSLRMLRRSWGLTLVGGLAMTVAIGIGVVVFWFLQMSFSPDLPLEEGERMVVIQTWDEKGSRVHDTSLQDLERWRGSLRSIENLGALRTVDRNLTKSSGPADPVSVAEMTASGFQLARVPPLLGRPLLEDDEREGAVPVVVIGYDEWQARFAGALDVVGKTMTLGGIPHEVVGVMPEGYSFPVNHSFWTPLQLNRADYARDRRLGGVVFARLADGATLKRAQVELTAQGLLPPLVAPETEEHLVPRVVPYALAFVGDVEPGEVPWVVRIILLLIVLLLVPPCANIAILIYARTISRQEEIAARFVLGASRSRIVTQLFIEVLVLAMGAAGMALLLASIGGLYLEALIARHSSNGAPFWIDFRLTWQTVVFAVGLAVVAAAVAGVVPALKATGRKMQSGFHALGGSAGVQLGKTWTALVVIQVALSLAALPSAMEMGWGTVRRGVMGPGFAAEEYLTAQLAIDREMYATHLAQLAPGEGPLPLGDEERLTTHFSDLQAGLGQELSAEPGVMGVTMAASVPGEESWARVEVEDPPIRDEGFLNIGRVYRFNHVDRAFFDVFEMPVLLGRGFEAGDFESAGSPVIVNQTFAEQALGEGNPLGRRFRYSPLGGGPFEDSDPWYEIVGVVIDRPANGDDGTVYFPMLPGEIHPASISLHAGVTAVSLANRLREVAGEVGPALRVEEVVTLGEIYRENAVGNNLGAFSLAMVTFSVLLLSAAGIYALMSFTVNHRRREIGIRSALGAQPSRLLLGIFRRALLQIAIGAGLGALIALLLDYYLPVEEIGGWNIPLIVPAAAAFMLTIGLLSAAGPARRGLRVDPIQELREG